MLLHTVNKRKAQVIVYLDTEMKSRYIKCLVHRKHIARSVNAGNERECKTRHATGRYRSYLGHG